MIILDILARVLVFLGLIYATVEMIREYKNGEFDEFFK